MAAVDEVLGYWDSTFHEDDKTISLMWTEYSDSFSIFYKRYLENQQKYGSNHGILAQPECLPPANSYTVSALPWVDFNIMKWITQRFGQLNNKHCIRFQDTVLFYVKSIYFGGGGDGD